MIHYVFTPWNYVSTPSRLAILTHFQSFFIKNNWSFMIWCQKKGRHNYHKCKNWWCENKSTESMIISLFFCHRPLGTFTSFHFACVQHSFTCKLWPKCRPSIRIHFFIDGRCESLWRMNPISRLYPVVLLVLVLLGPHNMVYTRFSIVVVYAQV